MINLRRLWLRALNGTVGIAPRQIVEAAGDAGAGRTSYRARIPVPGGADGLKFIDADNAKIAAGVFLSRALGAVVMPPMAYGDDPGQRVRFTIYG